MIHKYTGNKITAYVNIRLFSRFAGTYLCRGARLADYGAHVAHRVPRTGQCVL